MHFRFCLIFTWVAIFLGCKKPVKTAACVNGAMFPSRGISRAYPRTRLTSYLSLLTPLPSALSSSLSLPFGEHLLKNAAKAAGGGCKFRWLHESTGGSGRWVFGCCLFSLSFYQHALVTLWNDSRVAPSRSCRVQPEWVIAQILSLQTEKTLTLCALMNICHP